MFKTLIQENFSILGAKRNDMSILESLCAYNDQVFSKGDYSLLITSRILLMNRPKEINCRRFELYWSEKSADKILQLVDKEQSESGFSFVFDTILGSASEFSSEFGNEINFINLNARSLDSQVYLKGMELIDKHITKTYPQFKALKDIDRFMSQFGFDVRVFTSETVNKTFILFKNATVESTHAIQSIYPRLAPWLFKDNPPNSFELDLFSSLLKSSVDDYKRLVKSYEASLDLNTMLIDKLMKDVDLGGFLEKIRRRQDEINSNRNSIRDYLNAISQIYLRIDILQTDILVFQQQMEKGDEQFKTELVNYLKQNKSVRLTDVEKSDGSFGFRVSTTLVNFDPEAYKKIRDNSSCYIYTTQRNADKYSTQDVLLVLDSLFRDETLKLHTSAAFTLYPKSLSVRAFSYSLDNDIDLPNPHLYFYHCIGNNELEIIDALNGCNYIQAIETCVASAGNLNLLDTPVGGAFVSSLFGERIAEDENRRPFETKDGRRLNTDEAIAYLKGETICQDK